MKSNYVIFSLLLLAFACSNCGLSASSQSVNNENEIALRRARQNIEKFRKGDFLIKVKTKRSDSKNKVRLHVKQISHDFKFGCYLKLDDLDESKLPSYEKRFKQLFNYAVIGTYWDVTENERGAQTWQNYERELSFAMKNGWRTQAAPILWGTNQAGTPNWLPRKKQDLQTVLDERVRDFMTKNVSKIEDFEIVNEPFAPKSDVFGRSIGESYIDSAFKIARETSPNARLMINEYGVFGDVAANNYNRDRYLTWLRKSQNVPFDVIGIQAHANREWYAPADVAANLEKYAALGKPLQISEFSAQTRNYDDRKRREKVLGNYQTGFWDDEKQAQFYQEFYTIAFGNPQVEAIVQWGLDDERAWLPGIGLIDENENPKPNFIALDDLINRQWHTEFDANADEAKPLQMRGFYGDYQIEVFKNESKIKTIDFKLTKNSANVWLINL